MQCKMNAWRNQIQEVTEVGGLRRFDTLSRISQRAFGILRFQWYNPNVTIVLEDGRGKHMTANFFA